MTKFVIGDRPVRDRLDPGRAYGDPFVPFDTGPVIDRPDAAKQGVIAAKRHEMTMVSDHRPEVDRFGLPGPDAAAPRYTDAATVQWIDRRDPRQRSSERDDLFIRH